MTTTHRQPDVTNAEQVAAWDGTEGSYWASHAIAFDRTVERYQPHFHAAAAIGTHHRVLDIGCGTGLTTREAARSAPDGEALGIDLSAQMLDVARSAATREGLQNAHFLQADAQTCPFEPDYFDAVISRTGSMFFGRPEVAFANLAGALCPG